MKNKALKFAGFALFAAAVFLLWNGVYWVLCRMQSNWLELAPSDRVGLCVIAAAVIHARLVRRSR